MLIAQITDPHVTRPGVPLYGDYDPSAAFAATLAEVAALAPRPDLVLLTGDLTEHGAQVEYAEVRRLLDDFDLPVAAIPGNHDRRAAFVEGLSGSCVQIGALPWLHLTLEAGPLRFIGLDTLGADGGLAGLLCTDRLAWVAARLAEAPERPTLIFMHHQPFATGLGFMDAADCKNGDKLATIVAQHGNVVGVLCGHAHRAVVSAWAGTVATICPSVAYASPLDLGPAGPPRMVSRRPGYQLHLWREDLGLVTHTDYLPALRRAPETRRGLSSEAFND